MKYRFFFTNLQSHIVNVVNRYKVPASHLEDCYQEIQLFLLLEGFEDRLVPGLFTKISTQVKKYLRKNRISG